MIIGYARVSTDGQTLDAQEAALRNAGAERIFAEKVSHSTISPLYRYTRQRMILRLTWPTKQLVGFPLNGAWGDRLKITRL